jgi:two-component system chemotaxis sensor kinase CheA
MSDELQEIINEFVIEAEETLEKIDPMFIDLEIKGYDKDILNEIFRGMHTLKGAAGFLGFGQIVDVSHRAESIMKRLRDGELTLTKDLMDTILKSLDTLKLLISQIKKGDGSEVDISAILNELDSATLITKDQSQKLQNPENNEPQDLSINDPHEDVSSENLKNNLIVEDGATKEKAVRQTYDEGASKLRVDVTRIDKVMDLAGEIVLARNRLLNLSLKLDNSYSGDSNVESLNETISFLDRVTSDLQLAVMKMRMQPIQKVFSKFPRMVRDLSRNLGKDINLEIFGEDTEVDRTVIENIADPLVHIIRNSIDHGIEDPEERITKGKSREGKITISAYQKGTQIVIEVSDDGRGIDVEAVKRKALGKGLITEEEMNRISDEAAINLIFLPGFSTKDISTELSGRGVGMDVVKTNVAKLNGYVDVITKKDLGSTFRISLPLTLAIIQAMMVRIGSEIYAIPQTMIEETIRIKKNQLQNVTGQKVLTVRDKVLPVIRMSDLLGIKERLNVMDGDNDFILVTSVGERRFCISVDELLGQEEIVIKTISGIDLEECGIMGATITGDGKVVLILDLAVLSRRSFKTV